MNVPFIVAILLALVLVADTADAAEPAGTLVVLNKAGASVSLIDLGSGEVRATLPTGDGPHEAAASPDGALAVIGNYGTRDAPGSSLTVIDVAAAEVLRTIDLGSFSRPHGLLWLPDGRRVLATAEANRALIEVDIIDGRILRSFPTEAEISHMLTVALDGRRAFVANIGSGTVSAIDLEEGRLIDTIATGAGAEGIAASIDGREVWVTNRAADTVSVLDAASLEIKATIDCPSFPIRAATTPDGRHVLVSCARSGDIAVIDTASREVVRRVKQDLQAVDTEGRLFGDRFEESSVPIGIVVHPDGSRAWIAHSNADVVAELDLSSWTLVRLLTAGREPDGMAYTPVIAAAE